MLKGCKAIRVSDEYHCGRCGLQWGVKDDDKPDCKPPERPKPKPVK